MKAVEHSIMVWDRRCRVTVTQQAGTVWVASGDYLDRPVQTKGRNATVALNLWREAAQAMGDGRPIQVALSGLLQELLDQAFSPAVLTWFDREAHAAFRRAAVTSLPEQRRRLASALRALGATGAPFDRAIEIIKVFGG